MSASPSFFVYVANAESRELLVFSMDGASGELALVTDVLGGRFTTLAWTPDRRLLFAGLRDEPYAVASFAIDSHTGVLRSLGEVRVPGPLAYLSSDRTGRWLLAASYHENHIAICRIASDGTVSAPHQRVHDIAKAHCLVASPTNRFLVGASLGSDALLVWPFDQDHGTVDEAGVMRASVESGTGPRHVCFHPTLDRLYVIGELDASVRAFAFDPERGTLRERGSPAAATPKGFRGKRWAAELRLTPDGTLGFASERTSSTLTAYAIHPETGALELRGSFATEAQPRAFAIDPSGRFLLSVGQRSNRLSVYAIDAATGWLEKLRDYPVGLDPCWIEVLMIE